MAEAFRYGCPCCGSEEIEEANVVTVMYEITAWDERGRPARYGNMRETEAIGREDPPYWCRRCMKECRRCLVNGFGFHRPKRLSPLSSFGSSSKRAATQPPENREDSSARPIRPR